MFTMTIVNVVSNYLLLQPLVLTPDTVNNSTRSMMYVHYHLAKYFYDYCLQNFVQRLRLKIVAFIESSFLFSYECLKYLSSLIQNVFLLLMEKIIKPYIDIRKHNKTAHRGCAI